MEVPIGFSACLSYPWNVADVSIRFLQRQRSRGPHESIIASFEKLLPPFPLRPVKRRFSARRAATRLEFARVIPSAKPPTGWTTDRSKPANPLLSNPTNLASNALILLIRVAELVSPYTLNRRIPFCSFITSRAVLLHLYSFFSRTNVKFLSLFFLFNLFLIFDREKAI